jgi:hypothetical protein
LQYKFNCGGHTGNKYKFWRILLQTKQILAHLAAYIQIADHANSNPNSNWADLPRSNVILADLLHGSITEKQDFHGLQTRRLVRSSRPTEIFQPPQQGFFSVQGLSSYVSASRKDF